MVLRLGLPENICLRGCLMFNGWLEMFEKRELDKKGGGGGEKTGEL